MNIFLAWFTCVRVTHRLTGVFPTIQCLLAHFVTFHIRCLVTFQGLPENEREVVKYFFFFHIFVKYETCHANRSLKALGIVISKSGFQASKGFRG